MAQETRIGLLVGMGFIVCFAVILSNRGGLDRVAPQMPYQLFDGPAPLPRPGGTAGQERLHSLKLGEPPVPVGAVAPALAPRKTRPALPEGADDPERFIQRRRSLLPTRELAAAAEDVAQAQEADVDIVSESETLASSDSSAEDAPGEPGGAETDDQPTEGLAKAGAPPLPAVLAGFADQLEVVTPSPAPASQAPPRGIANAEKRTAKSAPVGQSSNLQSRRPDSSTAHAEHVVGKGDTLTRIARRYYGSTSNDVLAAILDANRGTLRSPDSLVLGRTLRLPAVGDKTPNGAGAEAAPTGGTGENTPQTTHQSPAAASPAKANGPEQQWRWYTVKKGDLYSTIAQEQLGTSRRWKELLALNKDVCPDARQLRQGLQIRIPIQALADAR